MQVLPPVFFDRDPQEVACDLVGKLVRHRVAGRWRQARIIEVEAYYQRERASHASLGYTEKRRALFMPPGTLYLYYARGGDSLNVSCRGPGNAVLIKSGVPWPLPGRDAPPGDAGAEVMLCEMLAANPLPSGAARAPERLCGGQTLLCRALGIRVPEWDARALPQAGLEFADAGLPPEPLLRTTRLGIPAGRDGHLPYRFVLESHAALATRSPLGRGRVAGRDFARLPPPRTASGASRHWRRVLRRSDAQWRADSQIFTTE